MHVAVAMIGKHDGLEGSGFSGRSDGQQTIPRSAANGSDVTAILLAGGAATRMGGCDKGLVKFKGTALAEHVAARLRPQCRTLVVSANRNIEIYRTMGYPVVSDAVSGYQGPLAGVAAALSAVQTPLAVVAPCDSPYVPMDYVERLLVPFQTSSGCHAAAVKAQGRPQPVFMMIDVRLRRSLEKYVAQGGRRVRGWLEAQNVVWVEFENLSDFDNLNSAEDIARAEHSDSVS